MPILLMLVSVQISYFLFFAKYQALKNPNRLHGRVLWYLIQQEQFLMSLDEG